MTSEVIFDGYELRLSDADVIMHIMPPQLAIELQRSKSCALVSDAMRDFTAAYAAERLSKPAYLAVIGALADLLATEGRPQ
jgi:hypothetical protein